MAGAGAGAADGIVDEVVERDPRARRLDMGQLPGSGAVRSKPGSSRRPAQPVGVSAAGATGPGCSVIVSAG
jgi:hypothetical protein